MHCNSGAAVQFVENIYMLLTHKLYLLSLRRLVKSNRPKEQEYVPHFALPTTSMVIKQLSAVRELSPEKVRLVNQAHEEFIKQIRCIFFANFS